MRVGPRGKLVADSTQIEEICKLMRMQSDTDFFTLERWVIYAEQLQKLEAVGASPGCIEDSTIDNRTYDMLYLPDGRRFS